MLVYALSFLLAAFQQSPAPDQAALAASLSRAQDLYVQARFKEAIDLLTPLDAALGSQPQRNKDRIDVKLQLALAHIGLNEMAAAGSLFSEICTIDPDYSLDPTRFSPKVVSLFEDAKATAAKAQCEMVCLKADQLLENGQAEDLLELIRSNRENCACIDATALDAASLFLKAGMDAYNKDDMPAALHQFRLARQFDPEHDLAGPYIDLARNRLQLAAQQTFLEWRTAFDARQFSVAAATYHKLESGNIEGSADDAVGKVKAAYRQRLSEIAASWKNACSRRDGITMNGLRSQASQMLPDAAIGQDILAEMASCSGAASGCVQAETDVMLAQTKHRQDAKLPPGLAPRPVQRNFALTVQTHVRVDEKGNAAVIDPESIDPKIRDSVVAAANKWKFTPTIVGNAARCVETTIPIRLNP